MLLTSRDGARVSLTPVGYQFPVGMAPGGWDANWLVIVGTVTTADGRSYSFEDASLTTWDAERLGRWLRCVLDGTVDPVVWPQEDDDVLQSFVEPNLAFSLAGRDAETVVIRVHLSLEALPPWLHGDDRPEIFHYYVELTVTPAALDEAVSTWESELTNWPAR